MPVAKPIFDDKVVGLMHQICKTLTRDELSPWFEEIVEQCFLSQEQLQSLAYLYVIQMQAAPK